MSFRPRERLFAKMSSLAAAVDWPMVIGRIPNAVREIPARLPVTDRCAENWLLGRSKPSADNVVSLLAEFDEVADAILMATRRKKNRLSEAATTKLLEVLKEME